MSALVCDNLFKKHSDSEIRNFSYNFLDNQIYAILEKNEEYQQGRNEAAFYRMYRNFEKERVR